MLFHFIVVLQSYSRRHIFCDLTLMNNKLTGFSKEQINPNKAAPPLGSYSHGVRVGPLLFLAGQGCRDPQTGIEAGITCDDNGAVIAYDIEAQTLGCINNLKTVLAAAGATLNNIADITVFLADMKDFAKYNAIYNQHFNFDCPPARTTIQAAKLPGKNFIEMKAIAVIPD